MRTDHVPFGVQLIEVEVIMIYHVVHKHLVTYVSVSFRSICSRFVVVGSVRFKFWFANQDFVSLDYDLIILIILYFFYKYHNLFNLVKFLVPVN